MAAVLCIFSHVSLLTSQLPSLVMRNAILHMGTPSLSLRVKVSLSAVLWGNREFWWFSWSGCFAFWVLYGCVWCQLARTLGGHCARGTHHPGSAAPSPPAPPQRCPLHAPRRCSLPLEHTPQFTTATVTALQTLHNSTPLLKTNAKNDHDGPG